MSIVCGPIGRSVRLKEPLLSVVVVFWAPRTLTAAPTIGLLVSASRTTPARLPRRKPFAPDPRNVGQVPQSSVTITPRYVGTAPVAWVMVNETLAVDDAGVYTNGAVTPR